MLQYSVKTNNFPVFYRCNRDMADLFVAWQAKLLKVIYNSALRLISLSVHFYYE